MHLAGGLEFAGFPSVIATLWAINDTDAPKIASYVCEHHLRNKLHSLDPSEAAAALNQAVLKLRAENPRDFTVDRWAPFIYFGIWDLMATANNLGQGALAGIVVNEKLQWGL